MPKLTAKQEMFCKEYLVDLNATQAAIRAGYSEDTAKAIGHENMTKPYLQERIQKEMNDRAKRTETTADYVLKSLRSLADKCQGLEDIEVSLQIDKDNPESQINIKKRIFDPSGAKGALELLGKHEVLFTDKIEHSGKIETTQTLSDTQLDEAIKKMEEKLNDKN